MADLYSVRFALSRLLPDCVAVHGLSFDNRLAAAGLPVPAALVHALPKRRAEFIAGRLCATAALRALGMRPDREIAIGAMGAPIWPRGSVGSITHTTGLAAAAVALTRDVSALGIDVEQSIGADAAEALAPSIAGADELRLARASCFDPRMSLAVLFAGKEALFKCLAPLVGRYFDFRDVEATSAAQGALSFRLCVDLSADFRSGRSFDVRCVSLGQMVLAAMCLPAADSGESRCDTQ